MASNEQLAIGLFRNANPPAQQLRGLNGLPAVKCLIRVSVLVEANDQGTGVACTTNAAHASIPAQQHVTERIGSPWSAREGKALLTITRVQVAILVDPGDITLVCHVPGNEYATLALHSHL